MGYRLPKKTTFRRSLARFCPNRDLTNPSKRYGIELTDSIVNLEGRSEYQFGLQSNGHRPNVGGPRCLGARGHVKTSRTESDVAACVAFLT
jgi:hypothetical protein